MGRQLISSYSGFNRVKFAIWNRWKKKMYKHRSLKTLVEMWRRHRETKEGGCGECSNGWWKVNRTGSVRFTDFPSELQLFMLPLLDSLLGCRLMFLVSSTAMPVSVLLWIGAPFSFLLFPSGWKRKICKVVVRDAAVVFHLFIYLFILNPEILNRADSGYSRRKVHVSLLKKQ